MIITIIVMINIYVVRGYLKRYDTTKMDNLYNYYSMNETKLLIIMGLILYGMCIYNKETYAWMILFIPVIYCVMINIITHIYIISSVQNAPKELNIPAKVDTSSADQIPKVSPPVAKETKPISPSVNIFEGPEPSDGV